MTTRYRLSATVDPELVAAGRAAVAAGEAPNLSAWVNEALSRQVEHERGLVALDVAIAAFEAEHGEITDADIAETNRRMQARSERVGGGTRDAQAMPHREAV